MADKFARTNFCNKSNINGTIECDLPFNDFNKFKFKRPSSFLTINKKYEMRPDLISFDVYGTVNYWWIICKVNDIDNVYEDMTIGKSIQIPAIGDIEDFYLQTRRKKR